MRSVLGNVTEILADPPAVAVPRTLPTGDRGGGDRLGAGLRSPEADGLLQQLPGRRVALSLRGRMLLEVANGESRRPLDEP